jgi:hypothetical protein
MSYLQTIQRFSSEDNLGGLVALQVARVADIESIADPSNGVIYGDIVFNPGKGFVTWNVSMESPQARSTERNTREGASKNNRLDFMVPKDRPGVKNQFNRAQDDEFVVLYRDANNNLKLFGTKDMPVRFEFAHDSGRAFSNLNAYAARFYYDGPDNIFFYNGEISTAPAGALPSVVKFNGTAIATLQAGETLNIFSDFGFTDFYVTP